MQWDSTMYQKSLFTDSTKCRSKTWMNRWYLVKNTVGPLVLNPSTYSLKKSMQYLFTFAFVALFDYAPELQRKTKECQGIRKESRKENKVTMRKYQWLQKHKQDTTAFNTLPVRQTFPSNCDKTCGFPPIPTTYSGTTREGDTQMTFASRNGWKIAIISSLLKPAEHILLLGSLMLSGGELPVYLHSPDTWMTQAIQTQQKKEPLGIKIKLLVPILVPSTLSHSSLICTPDFFH